MSASVSAKADVEGTSNGLGGFNYTIALADIGSTTIGTFWFSWVPGFSYMTQVPSSIGAPAGWTATVVPESGGYSIEWAANSPANYIQAGGSSSAFTFSSTETPTQLAANSTLAPTVPTTTSFVYSGAPFASSSEQFVPTVGAAAFEAANATMVPLQISPGLFQYTITLTDTGTTPIHTFWFAWDDVPDQDFMSQLPSNIGSPAGWSSLITSHVYPGGTGYGIEWVDNSNTADLGRNGSSSSFTFDSTETPQQFAAAQQLNDPSFHTTFPTTSSFVYSGAAELSPGGNLIVDVACFRAGTRIRTPSGDVAIEALHPGDPVVTAAGEMRLVRWIGRRRVNCQAHPRPERVWPIRVAACALGEGTPAADLYLSPDHALFLDGVLIPVKHLVNGSSIAPVPTGEVTWFHLELDSHEVILAEGAAAESFLDTGGRSAFDGAAPFAVSGPADQALIREASSHLPLVVTGSILARVRRRLADRTSGLVASEPADIAA